jgi:hypothetical protein
VGLKAPSRLSAANKRSTQEETLKVFFIPKQRLGDEFAAMAVQYLLLHTLLTNG